jgi:hypothetical protein
MSPEQLRSSDDVGVASDIWSLGIVLHELIAGAPPFLGATSAAIAAIVADATPSLRRTRADVPEELDRVISTALAKDPGERFPSAEAFGAALMPFASREAAAGPFSLRPSRKALAVARRAVSHAPASVAIATADELLELPVSRRGLAPEAHADPDAVRVFLGALAVGIGIASGFASFVCRPPFDASSPRQAVTSPATTTARLAADAATNVESLAARNERGNAASPQLVRPARPAQPVVPPPTREVPQPCRKPSGSTGSGGSSMRLSRHPYAVGSSSRIVCRGIDTNGHSFGCLSITYA